MGHIGLFSDQSLRIRRSTEKNPHAPHWRGFRFEGVYDRELLVWQTVSRKDGKAPKNVQIAANQHPFL